jgi:hypothetical protein
MYDSLIEAALLSDVAEAEIISWVMVTLTDLAVVGGVLWAVAACGFFAGKSWAWGTAVAASLPGILAGFFPVIPYLRFFWAPPPPVLLIFVVNLALFMCLVTYVRRMNGLAVGLAVLAGAAYILCFINGVAGTHYYLTYHQPLFAITPPLSMAASALWAASIPGFLLMRRWAWFTWFAASLLGLTSGIPLAVVAGEQIGRLSLFWPAPLVSLMLLVALWMPSVRQMADSRP